MAAISNIKMKRIIGPASMREISMSPKPNVKFTFSSLYPDNKPIVTRGININKTVR